MGMYLSISCFAFIFAVLCEIFYVFFKKISGANAMRGVLRMEVMFNGETVRARHITDEYAKFYPKVSIGRYYIPLQGMRAKSGGILLGSLLKAYAECYTGSGFGEDAIYHYLINCAGDCGDCLLRGTDRGKKFRLWNINAGISPEHLFTLSEKLTGLEKCTVYLPVSNTVCNSRFSEASEFSACGLEIELRYFGG